jgi:hypothetical protein
MSKRVADILIETLQAAGVKRCYGIVGDTLNRIAHAIQESKIEWVHMRHEEAGAFAASAEGQFTGELVACAGSCGPGSLHFINGLYEANRNRAPIVLIATQVVRQDIGFNLATTQVSPQTRQKFLKRAGDNSVPCLRAISAGALAGQRRRPRSTRSDFSTTIRRR